MYEVVLLNKNGEKFTKKFDSYYLYKQFLQKARKSKTLKVISYMKVW